MSYKNPVEWSAPEKALVPSERRDFHNLAVKLGAFAARVNQPIEKQDMRVAVDTSIQLSPKGDPSQWLRSFSQAWERAPGLKVGWETSEALVNSFETALQADQPTPERKALSNFLSLDYSEEMPEFVLCPEPHKGSAQEMINAYAKAKTGAVTAILEAESPEGGKTYLALAYDPEDIPNGFVFKAMQMKGMQLDEQSSADLERFEVFASRELPVNCVDGAKPLIPCMLVSGYGIKVTGLEQLQAQPHGWDMDAAQFKDIPEQER